MTQINSPQKSLTSFFCSVRLTIQRSWRSTDGVILSELLIICRVNLQKSRGENGVLRPNILFCGILNTDCTNLAYRKTEQLLKVASITINLEAPFTGAIIGQGKITMKYIAMALGATLLLISFAPFAAETIILIALNFGAPPLLHP